LRKKAVFLSRGHGFFIALLIGRRVLGAKKGVCDSGSHNFKQQ